VSSASTPGWHAPWRGERAGHFARRVLILLSGTAFVVAAAYSTYFHARVEVLPYDDAYITYRYVTNLLSGHGPVYNVSEHVFGSTTPLYVVWLTLLKAVFAGADLPTLAVRGNAFLHIVSAVVITGLCYRLTRQWIVAFGVGCVFLIDRDMLVISSGGMESFLFVALAIGSLWALAADRCRISGALAGFSMVTRPEGAFVLGLWFLYWLTRKQKRDYGALAVAATPIAAWIISATLYYGTPVPHSIIAKNRPLYLLEPGAAWREILAHLVTWSGASRLPSTTSWLTKLLAIVLAAICTVPLLLPGKTRSHGAWAPAIAFWLLVAFYAKANSLMFGWYYPIMYALWLVLVATGISAAGRWLRTRRSPNLAHPSQGVGWLVALVALCVVGSNPVSIAVGTWRSGDIARPSVAEPDRERVLAYRAAAETLNRTSTSSTTVLAAEIGAFGFYCKGHIYDACGLVSPQALPYLPAPNSERISLPGVIGRAYARALQADYVVSIPTFSRKSIEIDPWFEANYAVAGVIPLPSEVYGSRNVVIYEHRPGRWLVATGDVRWQEGIRLVRTVMPKRAQPGSSVPLTLVWENTAPTSRKWKVFLHLVDANGVLVSQADTYPYASDDWRASWEPGGISLDRHVLELPQDVPAGAYRLVAGLYDAVTGERLPREDGGDSYQWQEPLVIVGS
jgi:hypothetical protein